VAGQVQGHSDDAGGHGTQRAGTPRPPVDRTQPLLGMIGIVAARAVVVGMAVRATAPVDRRLRGHVRLVRALRPAHPVVLQSVCACIPVALRAGTPPEHSAKQRSCLPGRLPGAPPPMSGRGHGSRQRIRIGWGMLIGLMARTFPATGLFAVLLAVPLLGGCAALGLPGADVALDAQPATGADGVVPTPGAEASPTFFSSNDGYALTLPAGWVGTRTNNSVSGDALDLLSSTDVTLGEEASSILDDTGARMSMLGAESADIGVAPVPPGIAILIMPTNGASDAATQKRVGDIIDGLQTVDGTIEHSVIAVAAGDAHRYDLRLQGDTLSVQVRIYLFTVGDDGVLILCGRDTSLAADTWPDVDSMIKSLRFGV
jgi:hypothetical protein